LKWLQEEGTEDKKAKVHKANVQMKLAKANTLKHMRCGEAPGAASEAEKEAICDALALLKEVIAAGEEIDSKSVKIDAMKMTLQVQIQAENVSDAKIVLEELQTFTRR